MKKLHEFETTSNELRHCVFSRVVIILKFIGTYVYAASQELRGVDSHVWDAAASASDRLSTLCPKKACDAIYLSIIIIRILIARL